MSTVPPVALSVAGSDCSAGAGIQADLKTFEHFRVHGLTAITCVVSETANVVRAVHPVPPEIAADQVALLLDAFPVAAIKTGMLFSAAHISAIAAALDEHANVPLVVDPVMIASTGDSLLEPDAVAALKEIILPRALLVTPNVHEAEALSGTTIRNLEDLEKVASLLHERFDSAFLVKGGHLEGPDCTDVLVSDSGIHRFTAPRIKVAGSHGTGCTFSAAITAQLALEHPLALAVELAKTYLTDTLRQSYSFANRRRETVHALNQGTTL